MSSLLKCNAVFLHVPKTGGTFLRFFFERERMKLINFGYEHADMERALHSFKYYPANALKTSFLIGKNIDDKVKNSFKFCFVRNPYNWYESYWRFMMDYQWNDFATLRNKNKLGIKVDNWNPFSTLLPFANDDFNLFIKNVINNKPEFLTDLFNRYADPKHINYVGRYENLMDDVENIFNTLHVKFNKQHFANQEKFNFSKTAKPVWNETIKTQLYESEIEVFKRFGYDKAGNLI